MIVAAIAAGPEARVFVSVFAVGAAVVACVLYATLMDRRLDRSATTKNRGGCPDTHTIKGDACVPSAAEIKHDSVRYVLPEDGDADKKLCLGHNCKKKMGAIGDLGELNDAQVGQLCKMFKSHPYARLNVLDARCAR